MPHHPPALMGTRLEIPSAIYTNRVSMVDKILSHEIFLDAWLSERVLRLGQIFMAVQNAVSELVEYYSGLSRRLETPSPTVRHLFPDPLPVNSSATLPKLGYHGKLSYTGDLVDFSRRLMISTCFNGSRPLCKCRDCCIVPVSVCFLP